MIQGFYECFGKKNPPDSNSTEVSFYLKRLLNAIKDRHKDELSSKSMNRLVYACYFSIT